MKMTSNIQTMPSEVPLERPIQCLDQPHLDGTAPGFSAPSSTLWFRLLAFMPALITTFVVTALITDWFAMGGLLLIEMAIITLIGLTFFWIALSLATSTVGVLSLMIATPKAHDLGDAAPINVALLVPVYNEEPSEVFGNAAAMVMALSDEQTDHSYSIFILSDTQNEDVAALEQRAFDSLRQLLPPNAPVFYRRRIANTDRKVGNLGDWVERWGGGYDAMLVLDADSLMSGRAIVRLTDALAQDPAAGLIQSFPSIFGAQTLFGRVQQFSNRVYGAPLAEGLSRWADREGNYWGHNAIIRTRAFASCAGLPHVKGRGGKTKLILSHDFVEAGLLRRAGWAVRFLPRVEGSYEEVPPTLIDYVLRDRRWCQGNLQHLSLLSSRGFHAVSRFHLISGAMGYLMSPAWFTLLIIWSLVGNGDETNVVEYFSGLNAQVTWPKMSMGSSFAILGIMYGMLLAPKLLGAAMIRKAGLKLSDMGGLPQFLVSLSSEIALSIAYAPVLMVQQSIAVARMIFGYSEAWEPQNRKGGRYSVLTLMKFHSVETILGVLLLAGIGSGLVTLWLIPIALSLAFAVPLSDLSGVNLERYSWSSRQLGTPEVNNVPLIIKSAMEQRSRIALDLKAPSRIAAE